jgi:hypothetical protein
MSEKHKKIYHALLDGATEGLSGKKLHEFVMGQCPKASSKKIVRAALLALTDPHVADRNVLNTIYALAIKHRMDELGQADLVDDADEKGEIVPALKSPRKRRVATTEAVAAT